MPTRWYNGIVQKPTYQRRIYAMSIIAQNSDKEVAILDCVNRFFPITTLETFWKNAMERKKKVFQPSHCFVTNLEMYFPTAACICRCALALSKRTFPKMQFIVFWTLLKRTGLDSPQLWLPQSLMTRWRNLQMKSVQTYSFWMILSSIVPVAREPSLVPKFWPYQHAIQKRLSPSNTRMEWRKYISPSQQLSYGFLKRVKYHRATKGLW